MNIVMVTHDRPELTEQTIRTLVTNAANWDRHRLLVVIDGSKASLVRGESPSMSGLRAQHNATHRSARTVVHNAARTYGSSVRYLEAPRLLGVGGAKNFGADHIEACHGTCEPQRLIMFTDNDHYYLPNWDARLELAFERGSIRVDQLGGWSHPFNVVSSRDSDPPNVALNYNTSTPPPNTGIVIGHVDAVGGGCFVMNWEGWRTFGPFADNATGPAQSEDVDLSLRICAAGGEIGCVVPYVAINCGLTRSDGSESVGADVMRALADSQIEREGLSGKVVIR